MIGRVDVEIPTHAGRSALDSCVRVIRQFWPNCFVEDAESGERYGRYVDIPLGSTTELLVYRDEAIAAQWDELGTLPGLSDTMIHLLYDEGCITAVVDDPDSDSMNRMLATLRSGLNHAD